MKVTICQPGRGLSPETTCWHLDWDVRPQSREEVTGCCSDPWTAAFGDGSPRRPIQPLTYRYYSPSQHPQHIWNGGSLSTWDPRTEGWLSWQMQGEPPAWPHLPLEMTSLQLQHHPVVWNILGTICPFSHLHMETCGKGSRSALTSGRRNGLWW